MSSLFALLLPLAAAGLLGHPLWLLLGGAGHRLPELFARLALGLAVIGWLAFLLAEMGLFSLPLLAGLTAVLLLALFFLAGRRRPQSSDPPDPAPAEPLSLPTWLETAVLLLWLAAASWLFFRPHEYLLGGADAGVYVNLAANIAQSGAIAIEDPLLADLDPALYPALLRPLPENETARRVAPSYIFPAFFVSDAAAGQITPQFYHLHPTWQAVAYSLGGLRGALLITGLWALLGSLAVYLTLRRLAGWQIALLALAGMSANALQVWFARYPVTETLTQFLLWTGLWATVVWLKRLQKSDGRAWGLLAGLALGQVFLVRIDSYFLLAIPGAIWLWLRWSGRWQTRHYVYFVPVAALTGHSLLHAFWQSRPYFYNIFGYGLRLLERSPWLPLLAGGLGVGLLLLFGRFRHQLAQLERWRRPATLLACALLIGLALYGWFIRPQLGEGAGAFDDWYGGGQIPRLLDNQNLLRLGWYLSPLGIALAVAGCCLLLWQADRQKLVILTAGLIFSLLYLWRIQANPHQIYAMRRYVPVTLPFAMISSAYLLGRLLLQRAWWRRGAGLLLVLLWLAGLLWSGRGFFSQVDHQGLAAQFDALDAQLPEQAILIFDHQAAVTRGDILGTPLHFIYGHDVLSLRDPQALDPATFAAAVSSWQADNRPIYWVGDNAPPGALGVNLGQPFSFEISSPALEGTYDRKPVNLVTARWVLLLRQIE